MYGRVFFRKGFAECGGAKAEYGDARKNIAKAKHGNVLQWHGNAGYAERGHGYEQRCIDSEGIVLWSIVLQRQGNAGCSYTELRLSTVTLRIAKAEQGNVLLWQGEVVCRFAL